MSIEECAPPHVNLATSSLEFTQPHIHLKSYGSRTPIEKHMNVTILCEPWIKAVTLMFIIVRVAVLKAVAPHTATTPKESAHENDYDKDNYHR